AHPRDHGRDDRPHGPRRVPRLAPVRRVHRPGRGAPRLGAHPRRPSRPLPGRRQRRSVHAPGAVPHPRPRLRGLRRGRRRGHGPGPWHLRDGRLDPPPADRVHPVVRRDHARRCRRRPCRRPRLARLSPGSDHMQTISDLPWLSILIVVPLVAAAVIWLVPGVQRAARTIGLAVSLLVLAGFVVMASGFDLGAAAEHQFVEQASWIPQLGVSWALGVNGLGLALVGLSVFLVPLALLAAWREQEIVPEGAVVARRQAGFVALVLLLEATMVAVFSARDVFLFYVVFEAMLIPVYFLIGNYGGPKRRHAAIKFLVYSLASGLIMLVGVIALGVMGPGGEQAFLIDTLAGTELGVWAERWIFISFFIAFAVKAPMWPVHTWLPDAAQQASPGTSALLVGVLDKVGTFGMLALCLPLFPEASRWAA